VRAERVAVSSDAWLVVHRAADGGGPDISRIVGVSFAMHGTTEAVPIHFDAAVSRGETLYAMLHHDTGSEFEHADPKPAAPRIRP
jgi:hypothetical protein